MKVALYARVSRGTQDYENQLIQLKNYCEKQKHEIINIYTEKISGKESNRPEFKQMMEDASQRKFDTIIVWSLDRFSREGTAKIFYYLNLLKSYNVQFMSYTESFFNTDNEFTRDLMFAIMGALAKQERIKISERVKAGLERTKQEGQKLGRPLVKDSIKEQIINCFLDKKTYAQICSEVFYWDKNSNKKFVSKGFVHKTIKNFQDKKIT